MNERLRMIAGRVRSRSEMVAEFREDFARWLIGAIRMCGPYRAMPTPSQRQEEGVAEAQSPSVVARLELPQQLGVQPLILRPLDEMNARPVGAVLVFS